LQERVAEELERLSMAGASLEVPVTVRVSVVEDEQGVTAQLTYWCVPKIERKAEDAAVTDAA
jgi:hypothetical protein